MGYVLQYHRCKKSYPSIIDGSNQETKNELSKAIVRSDRTSFTIKERWIDLHIQHEFPFYSLSNKNAKETNYYY